MKGAAHVNAFRRGWIGLALFFSALVLMPVLVVEYQSSTQGTAGLAAAEYTGIAPGVPAAGTSPAARPGAGSGSSGSGTRPWPDTAAGSRTGDGSGTGAGAGPLATVSPPPSTLPPPNSLVGFAGVAEGETISGFRRITLQTSGSIGRIDFVLTGPTGHRYNVRSAGPPHVFGPHGSGWQTSAVVDGAYSLEAVADTPGVTPVSVHFRVSNHTAPLPTASR